MYIYIYIYVTTSKELIVCIKDYIQHVIVSEGKGQ